MDFVQIREKHLCDRELFLLTRAAVEAAAGTCCRIVVNGRADIALAARAHGVHLPAAGLRVSDVKQWLPGGFLVGVSTHSAGEASRAGAAGADYVLLGPVFRTESKVRYGPPLGQACLRRACRVTDVPVFALGGIRPEFVPLVLKEGAAGVAGISLFQDDSQFQKLGSRRIWIAQTSL